MAQKGFCIPCPEGYHCAQQATAPTACDAGYYCPMATESATQYPCPIGTYNSRSLRSSKVDCLPCDPGSYCATAALAAPTGACTEGYYCTAASPTPTPGDASTPSGYQTIYPAISASGYGGKCGPGTYCPAASPIAAPCPAGRYCPAAAMGVSAMLGSLCEQGKYCSGGTSGLSGALPVNCPAGHYCPAGSSSGIPCPAGTVRAAEGASALS